jgi:hypothetical protein
MRILMVVPSSDGEAGTPVSGEEIVQSYYVLVDGGAEVVLASPLGGPSAVVVGRGEAGAVVDRFQRDEAARAAFADTLRLDQAYASDFDAIFFPCGLDDVVPIVLADRSLDAPGNAGHAYVVRDRALVRHRPSVSPAEAAAALISSLG